MQRVSSQIRHPSATLDWERLIRTDTAIYPKTPTPAAKRTGQGEHP